MAASALDVRLGRPERIISLADEARRIHAALHDSRAVAGALVYRGVLESARARYAAARDTLEEAFAEAQRANEALVAAESRHAQGVEAHCRGRDEDARRLMEGGQSSIEIGLAVGFASTIFGLIYGAISGYAGGWVDGVLMRVVDTLFNNFS